MPNRNTLDRTPRRPETQPPESDVAAIFERRLLARGIRPDDFLDWRNSTDLPTIPAIAPIAFGRGSGANAIRPMAVIEPVAPQPTPEPDPETEPDSTATPDTTKESDDE